MRTCEGAADDGHDEPCGCAAEGRAGGLAVGGHFAFEAVDEGHVRDFHVFGGFGVGVAGGREEFVFWHGGGMVVSIACRCVQVVGLGR